MFFAFYTFLTILTKFDQVDLDLTKIVPFSKKVENPVHHQNTHWCTLLQKKVHRLPKMGSTNLDTFSSARYMLCAYTYFRALPLLFDGLQQEKQPKIWEK